MKSLLSGFAFLVLCLSGCKKDTGPDTSLHRGGGDGKNSQDGFNEGVDFAQSGGNIENLLEDDPLAFRDPGLEAFSDPLNVIRPFETVLFGFDQYNLTTTERPKVEEVADFQKKNRKARLVVEGYCDWKGTPEYNKSLGDRRASSVKSYLVDLGCDSSRIEIVSIGDEKAIPNATPSQASTERCAQFLVLKGS